MIKRMLLFATILLIFYKGIAAMTANSIVQALTKDNAELLIKSCPALLVLDVGAEWCGPCKKMAPEFEKAAQDFKGKYLFAKLDVENCPESIIKEYEIKPIPALLVLQQGKLLDKSIGFKTAEEIKKFIEEAVQGPKDYTKLSKEELKGLLQTHLMTGSAETIKAILATGLDVNAPLPNGIPPLAYLLMAGATQYEQLPAKAKILLDAGATPTFTISGQATSVDELTNHSIVIWERLTAAFKDVQMLAKEYKKPAVTEATVEGSIAKLEIK